MGNLAAVHALVRGTAFNGRGCDAKLAAAAVITGCQPLGIGTQALVDRWADRHRSFAVWLSGANHYQQAFGHWLDCHSPGAANLRHLLPELVDGKADQAAAHHRRARMPDWHLQLL